MMNVDYKKRNLIRLVTIFVILIVLPAGSVFCQQPAFEQVDNPHGQHQEVFAVFTDRNLYIVGEKILFTLKSVLWLITMLIIKH